MKLLSGLCAMAFSQAVPQPASRPAGLYFTACEFRAARPSQSGTDVGTNLFSTKAVLVNQASAEERCVRKVPLNKLWGYVEKDGTAWRIFNEERYRIESVDTFMVYSRLTSNGRFTSKHYYFSTGLAAAPAPLSRFDLRQIFADNPRFLARLKGLHWYDSPQDRDKSTQQYRAAQLFHQALSQ